MPDQAEWTHEGPVTEGELVAAIANRATIPVNTDELANGAVTDDKLDPAISVPSRKTVDTVDGVGVVHPLGTEDNGFIIKAPSAGWGDGTPYGTAQALMLMREDYVGGAEPEPDRNVLFRVNGRDGGIGTAGGLHVAFGLRQHADWTPAPTGALWVQLFGDAPGIVVSGVDGQAEPLFRAESDDGLTHYAVLSAEGHLTVRGELAARTAQGHAVGIGSLSTFGGPARAGIVFGDGADVNLYRDAVDVLRTDDFLQVVRDITARHGDPAGVFMGELGTLLGAGYADKGGLIFGAGADVNLYRDGANILKTDNAIQSEGDQVAQVGNTGQVYSGDVGTALGGAAKAGIVLGPAADTLLSRTAANELSIGDADTFRLGNGSFIHWGNAANQQTTVGAAGAADALPATPAQYLKVKNAAGATLVIPAYAAA